MARRQLSPLQAAAAREREEDRSTNGRIVRGWVRANANGVISGAAGIGPRVQSIRGLGNPAFVTVQRLSGLRSPAPATMLRNNAKCPAHRSSTAAKTRCRGPTPRGVRTGSGLNNSVPADNRTTNENFPTGDRASQLAPPRSSVASGTNYFGSRRWAEGQQTRLLPATQA